MPASPQGHSIPGQRSEEPQQQVRQALHPAVPRTTPPNLPLGYVTGTPIAGIPVTSFPARRPDIIAREASLGTRRRAPPPVRSDRPAGGRARVARPPAGCTPRPRSPRPPLDATGRDPPDAEVPWRDPGGLAARHPGRPGPRPPATAAGPCGAHLAGPGGRRPAAGPVRSDGGRADAERAPARRRRVFACPGIPAELE